MGVLIRAPRWFVQLAGDRVLASLCTTAQPPEGWVELDRESSETLQRVGMRGCIWRDGRITPGS